MGQKSLYRTDIDGLRAFSVLSVILFHINPKWIEGGFLGVDVFFVISGYLISLILIKDLKKNGKIDFSRFYERRIRRILPALFFMLFVSTLVAFFLLLPKDLTQYFRSLIWSVLSLANVFFYTSLDSSYFAAPTSEVPLLHLWSLGVEEQFYFIYPIFLLALYKKTSSTKKIIFFFLFLFFVSFIWAHYSQKSNQSFAHYMLFTRAWELLAGGICATMVSSGFSVNKKYSEFLSFLGLLFIVASFFFVSENNSVPGLACLPIVVGSSFILLANVHHKTLVSFLLSFRPLVFIGLVSYSAYLWHWPILAFLRYALVDIDVAVGILVLLLTFSMAVFSYYFVEQPFRTYQATKGKVYLLGFLVPSASLVFLSLFCLNSLENKRSWVFPWEKISHIKEITQAAYKFKYNCQYALFTTDAYQREDCIYPKGQKPTALLLGDSNASHYLGMMRVIAKEYDFTIANYIQSSCPLVFDVEYSWISKRKQEACSLYRKSIKKHLLNYETLYVGGSWSNYDKKGFRKSFKKSLSYLAKNAKKVVLFAQVPRMDNYSHDCEMRSSRLISIDCKTKFNNQKSPTKMNKFLKRISKKYSNVEYFDIRGVLCPKDKCSPYFEGKPVYYDPAHLSMLGSQRIGEALLREKSPLINILL